MKKLLIFTLILISASALCAQSLVFNKNVRVIKSSPEYRTVTLRTPYQECWDEQVPVNVNTNRGNSGNNIGALIGGVAGGILGHQVGGGNGKTVATVGGAIVGTLVGKNLSNNHGYQGYQTSYQNRRHCVTRYKEGKSDRFMGYRNIANYKNHTITKYSDTPLQFIRLTISVTY